MSAEPEDYHSNIAFQNAIAEWQNSGGTFGVAYAMLCAAYGRKEPPGQRTLADEAKPGLPGASPQDAAEGQPSSADEAVVVLPDAAAERSGEGQAGVANKASGPVLSSASTHKPGHAKHGMASISAIQGTLSKSLFDRIKLPDGRTLREIRWSECPNLATRYRRLSRILMALWAHGTPTDPNTTVDNLISDSGLKQIVEAVERFNDIH